MKILIVSDTHGKCENFEKVLSKVEPIDACIHCGDVEGSEDYIQALTDCPVYMVSGNNDFFSELDREMIVELCGHRIFITHGHYYGVSLDLGRIREEGAARQTDIVAFGHTHKPVVKEKNGITVINPGSLSYPRQEGRRPTYMILEFDKKGLPHFTINEL